MTRADDVQTFSFQQTTRSIKQRLPFTFAVVNAIAGADRDDSGGSASSATSNADPQASAIADAFDGLPTSAASLSMEQSGSEQDVLRDDVGLEAWDALIGDWEDDEDLLGAETHLGATYSPGGNEDQEAGSRRSPSARRRGKRSPKVLYLVS
ncbi:unnamed protein product [Tilletia controversa]|nr:unnamed protein product [Tilletia controversa]